jgi:Phytoene/squalene synthetase
MPDKSLFDKVCFEASKITTRRYSTSFSSAIRLLHKSLHEPIYNIYGFVRFADEIVDTFHDFDKEQLLRRFKEDTYMAIEQKISLNPILNSFQKTVHEFQIPRELIDTFLHSMEMDLNKSEYTSDEYDRYILGSAKVVGLMCLKVFVAGSNTMYERLKPYAMRLGAAFQKINFLRDIREDSVQLSRIYFPGLKLQEFNQEAKRAIENEIEADFKEAYKGILQLPKASRFGVYLAYVYYLQLLKKIKSVAPERVIKERIRVPNAQKLLLVCHSYIRHNLNLLK